MALAIKSIPVIEGDEALRLYKQIQKNTAKKKVDFSAQIIKARKILKKSKLD